MKTQAFRSKDATVLVMLDSHQGHPMKVTLIQCEEPEKCQSVFLGQDLKCIESAIEALELARFEIMYQSHKMDEENQVNKEIRVRELHNLKKRRK